MILPFPGGIARSGSKVGSKYKSLRASTNTAFAPMLRGLVATELPPEVRCVYEIVIDGLTLEAVERATVAGIRAVDTPAIVASTSGNYAETRSFPYPVVMYCCVTVQTLLGLSRTELGRALHNSRPHAAE